MNTRVIALGALIDLACTKLFMLALLIVLLDPGSSSQPPIERTSPELLENFCLVWGCFFTGLGAFVAARLAPAAPMRHAMGVGLTSLAISTLFYNWTPSEAGLGLYCFGTVLGLGFSALGGRLAKLNW